MKRRILTLVFLAGLAALGFWGWRFLHPGPEQIIRKNLTTLAKLACVPANEGSLAKLANAQKVASYFTIDTQITIDMRGRFAATISGRNEVQEKEFASRAALPGLQLELLDVSVSVAPDGQTATAHLTGKANLPGESTPQVDEFKAELKKVDGDWLIHRVENVKTLH